LMEEFAWTNNMGVQPCNAQGWHGSRKTASSSARQPDHEKRPIWNPGETRFRK
jgi:hypothetical protein